MNGSNYSCLLFWRLIEELNVEIRILKQLFLRPLRLRLNQHAYMLDDNPHGFPSIKHHHWYELLHTSLLYGQIAWELWLGEARSSLVSLVSGSGSHTISTM